MILLSVLVKLLVGETLLFKQEIVIFLWERKVSIESGRGATSGNVILASAKSVEGSGNVKISSGDSQGKSGSTSILAGASESGIGGSLLSKAGSSLNQGGGDIVLISGSWI